jgi:diguanylate cyclase (GGDEF)-like protein/putative nucleotidyltransferase with HDIG domain
VTSIPSDLPAHDADAPARQPSLPRRATLFLTFVAVATFAATAPFYHRLFAGQELNDWVPFAVLGIAAALTQLFPVGFTTNQMLHTSIVFLCAASLLVDPELLVVMCLLVCVPEWLKVRYPWYIQLFNICNYTLNALAAWGVAHLVEGGGGGFVSSDAREALAGVLAAVTFVATNRALLAIMLNLGRGHSLRKTFTKDFALDLVLTTLGVALAAFWETNPWLIPIALGPLLVLHRTLAVPALEAQARVDPKTGLFNARYFATQMAEELSRAQRFGRPLSLMMADLDLLRDINNSYGHLAGDAVLKGIAEVFREQLRHYDVPARFGGEEFSILLPETPPEQALEIAERIRRAVAEKTFDVETSSEPIRATVSIGVAAFPNDATDSNELIHQADLAVYRAKLQGRNRVLGASSEPLLVPAERSARLAAVPDPTPAPAPVAVPRGPEVAGGKKPAEERRASHPRPHAVNGPRFFSLSGRLSTLVALVSLAGGLAGGLGLFFGTSTDLIGLLAVTALVGVAQALALEAYGEATLSVSAVGALAGAALFGPRAALAIAITTCVVEWSARRPPLHTVLFNVATLTLASLTAAAVFGAMPDVELLLAAAGVAAGAAYFAINMGLVSLALAVEGHERWRSVFRERFSWLLPSYVVYGFVGGVIAIGYEAAGLYALAVFAVPLLLMRKTMEAYLAHTQKSAQKLRQAAETIQTQNVSLEQANKLLKERSTAAMESLSATVDARDSYTAGHSRRVQQLALAIGREMGLSQAELDLLGHAALFHDIGKLAIPDAVLLKPATLTDEEWELMQRHADEGARIIDRLGFLNDAVPAIRHHHEHWDGSGYPDRLAGEDIPLGARIIHVADALDSMLTTRIYRAARPAEDALEEVRGATGKQFCPRTVAALERILANEGLDGVGEPRRTDLLIAS